MDFLQLTLERGASDNVSIIVVDCAEDVAAKPTRKAESAGSPKARQVRAKVLTDRFASAAACHFDAKGLIRIARSSPAGRRSQRAANHYCAGSVRCNIALSLGYDQKIRRREPRGHFISSASSSI